MTRDRRTAPGYPWLALLWSLLLVAVVVLGTAATARAAYVGVPFKVYAPAAGSSWSFQDAKGTPTYAGYQVSDPWVPLASVTVSLDYVLGLDASGTWRLRAYCWSGPPNQDPQFGWYSVQQLSRSVVQGAALSFTASIATTNSPCIWALVRPVDGYLLNYAPVLNGTFTIGSAPGVATAAPVVVAGYSGTGLDESRLIVFAVAAVGVLAVFCLGALVFLQFVRR